MGAAGPDGVWPPPSFSFRVTLFDGVWAPFQEVSGMDGETRQVEYRHGDGPAFHPRLPARSADGSMTLRRGTFPNDDGFRRWFDQVRTNTAAPRTVTLVLLDEAGAPRMTWTLGNARPTQITGADLPFGGNEVAVESLEIAYETLAVATP